MDHQDSVDEQTIDITNTMANLFGCYAKNVDQLCDLSDFAYNARYDLRNDNLDALAETMNMDRKDLDWDIEWEGKSSTSRKNDLLSILNRPGITGNAHPETSRKAGTTPRKGSQRLAVLNALFLNGPMTAFKIAKIIERSPNQTAARLLELHEDGFVRHVHDDNGETVTAETTLGNTGRVHRITALGTSAWTKAGG